MRTLLKAISEKRIYFALAALFFIMMLILVILYPGGRSFFIVNGVHHPAADSFFKYFTHAGDGVTAGVIGALLLIAYRYAAGIAFLSGFAVTGLLNSALKTWVFIDAPRPTLFFWKNPLIHLTDGVEVNIEHSFPSGHTNTAFFIFTFLALLTWRKNLSMQLICVICACLVAYSRVYLAQHFVGDILGGMCIGVIGALIFYGFYRTLRSTRKLDSNLIKSFRAK